MYNVEEGNIQSRLSLKLCVELRDGGMSNTEFDMPQSEILEKQEIRRSESRVVYFLTYNLKNIMK